MQHFSSSEVLTAHIKLILLTRPLITFITSLIMSSANNNLSNNSLRKVLQHVGQKLNSTNIGDALGTGQWAVS